MAGHFSHYAVIVYTCIYTTCTLCVRASVQVVIYTGAPSEQIRKIKETIAQDRGTEKIAKEETPFR